VLLQGRGGSAVRDSRAEWGKMVALLGVEVLPFTVSSSGVSCPNLLSSTDPFSSHPPGKIRWDMIGGDYVRKQPGGEGGSNPIASLSSPCLGMLQCQLSRHCWLSLPLGVWGCWQFAIPPVTVWFSVSSSVGFVLLHFNKL